MASSTIPGAVTTLQGYMTTIAATTTVSNVGVYVGYSTPLTGMSPNFMMVGDFEEGLLYTPVDMNWAALGAAAKYRSEEYSLHGCIRCWAGGNDINSRIADAFTLLNALEEQIISDPGGSGTLSGSGSWGKLTHTMVAAGALENVAGFGVIINFDLEVINVRLTG